MNSDVAAPLFIVGMPRSGTTLLASMLNASPDLAVTPETDYFPNFWRSCERSRCMDTPGRRGRFIHRWLNSPEAQRLGLGVEETLGLEAKLIARAAGHAEILGSTLQLYADRRGKRRWGEKTPAHVFHVQTIQRLFPNSMVIQIVRDPRDILLSLERVPFASGNLIRYMRLWKSAVNTAPLNSQRYRVVRYEDILAAPEATLRGLSSFVEIEYSTAMVHPDQSEDRMVDAVAEPWKSKAVKPLDPNNRDKWRQQMAQRDRRLVSNLAGHEITRFGYDPDKQDPTWNDGIYQTWRRTEDAGLMVMRLLRRGIGWLQRMILSGGGRL